MPLNAAFKRPSDADAVVVVVIMMMTFFCQKDHSCKMCEKSVTDTQALSDYIFFPFNLKLWWIWMDMLVLADGWFYFVNNKT